MQVGFRVVESPPLTVLQIFNTLELIIDPPGYHFKSNQYSFRKPVAAYSSKFDKYLWDELGEELEHCEVYGERIKPLEHITLTIIFKK